MTSIRVRELTFAFGEGETLFGPISFSLEPGRAALVGANGAGKTTLLRLLAGELMPSSGSVRASPDDLQITLVPQEVERLGEDVTRLASRDDRLAHRIGVDLALDAGALPRWSTLSPGERKRWQIGAALAREPDVLLLDEPTNHLDGDARTRLVGALRRFRGICLIVSHDRALLDEVTERTLRLARRGVDVVALPYTGARETWEDEARAREASRDEQKRVVRAARQRKVDMEARVAASTRTRYASARMRNPGDRDATGMLAGMRAERSQGKTSGHAARAEEALTRAESKLGEMVVDKTIGRSLFVGFTRSERPVLATLRGDVTRGERVVQRDVDVRVLRDTRIRIAGANGSGKTSLALALTRACTLPNDEVLYVPQDLTEEDGARLRRALDDLNRERRARVLSLVAALGVDPDVLLRSKRLSPGEARKLAIAFGLARNAKLLVLDEPTNHLDLPSIERLERALAAYPGAVVLVTHDDALAAACTNETLLLLAPNAQSAVSGLHGPHARHALDAPHALDALDALDAPHTPRAVDALDAPNASKEGHDEPRD